MNNPKHYIDEAMSEENRALRDELYLVTAEKALLEERVEELENENMRLDEEQSAFDMMNVEGNKNYEALQDTCERLYKALEKADNTLDLLATSTQLVTDRPIVERNLFEIRETIQNYIKGVL